MSVPDDPALNDAEPLGTVEQWLALADRGGRRNPNAMALATTGEHGRPSARMVLLKALVPVPGYVVFYTNYESRKARELARTPYAAAVMYWEELGRQVRLEGPVLRSPDAESDAYFATRPFLSQINAWVSAQSRPLDDPGELERRATAKVRELGAAGDQGSAGVPAVPRPPFWGGYRLWCEAVELWTEGDGRFHQRVRYERELTPDAGGFRGSPWRRQRLQP